jgi:hypothetical protein
MNLAGYYAQSKYQILAAEPLSALVHRSHPDVILLAKAGVAADQLNLAVANLIQLEYHQIDNTQLPADCRYDVVVLARPLLEARNKEDTDQR